MTKLSMHHSRHYHLAVKKAFSQQYPRVYSIFSPCTVSINPCCLLNHYGSHSLLICGNYNPICLSKKKNKATVAETAIHRTSQSCEPFMKFQCV